MDRLTDYAYYLRRAEQCRIMAATASCEQIAELHLRLAIMHEDVADDLRTRIPEAYLT